MINIFKSTHLIVFFLLSGQAHQSFASKARLLALGAEKDGSYYIDDSRNIFLNPAQLNHYTDYIVLEWGQDLVNSSTASQSAAEDTDTVSRAEGGYIKQSYNLIYGLYLGGENDVVNRQRYRVSENLPGEDNKVDLFIGGDAGILWGVNFGFSLTKDEVNNDSKSTTLFTRFGVQTKEYDFFGLIEISNDAEAVVGNSKIEYQGELGFHLGFVRRYTEYSLFAHFKHLDFEFDNATDLTSLDDVDDYIGNGKFEQDELILGLGKVKIVNEKAKVFSKISLTYLVSEKDLDSGTDIKKTEYDIPVSIGLEYEAKNWLVLRGSISQSLYSKYEQGKLSYTKRNTANVNAGASFVWGTFQIDGLVGTSGNGTTVDSQSETGSLSFDNLMTKVSMKYRF
jgi:hypothetical protein